MVTFDKMCRAYLSPIYQSGKLTPVDENDKPIFQGRFNGGAISLNLPMILRKSQLEHKDFYEVLDHYLEMINQIHIKTYDFLCKLKASCNPVAFCEGGFATLKPEDTIKSCVDRITFSYGFTAQGELIPPMWDDTWMIQLAEQYGTLPILTLTPFGPDGQFNNQLITSVVNNQEYTDYLIQNIFMQDCKNF